MVRGEREQLLGKTEPGWLFLDRRDLSVFVCEGTTWLEKEQVGKYDGVKAGGESSGPTGAEVGLPAVEGRTPVLCTWLEESKDKGRRRLISIMGFEEVLQVKSLVTL